VRILIRVEPQAIKSFLLKHCREKRVVAPVGRHNYCTSRQILAAQQRINGVGLSARIPRKPQFRAWCANRRPEQ
jgi:hypothetical protein